MADPMTMALVGAGTGAMMNKDDPLMGAALGGMGGYFLGPMAGKALGMGSGAAGVGELAAGIPFGSEQAAMLSAQTAEFGPEALGMLRASANPAVAGNGGLFSNVKNFLGQDAVGGMSRGDLLQAGGKLAFQQPEQPQGGTISNPYAMSQGQQAGPMPKPYGVDEEMRRKQMLAGFNNLSHLPRAIG